MNTLSASLSASKWLAVMLLGSALAGCYGAPDDLATDTDNDPDASTQSAQPLTVLGTCGQAGQACCPDQSCNAGLACNGNNICRQPCGAVNQRCCLNRTCNEGLRCNESALCEGLPPPPPPDRCNTCTTRSCGWDNSCGPTRATFCGSCPSGSTCNSTGQCVSSSGGGGGSGFACGGPCPSGQSCLQDSFGAYCGFQL